MNTRHIVTGAVFAVGVLTGKLWFDNSASEMARSPGAVESISGQLAASSNNPAQPTATPPKDSLVATPPDRSNTSSQTEKELSAEQILTKFPPPHLSDPYFYKPGTDAAEIRAMRRKSLNELIASMQQGGVDAGVIAQVRVSYERAIDENSALDMNTYNNTVVATYEQQAADLNSSLRLAGESEEIIANSLSRFSNSPEAQPVSGEARLPHTDMHPR